MKNNVRLNRINDEIQKELSELLRAGMKDPRLAVMTSIIKVETTNDLSHCNVAVSVLGTDEQKKEVMKGLKNATGHIRSHIAERMNLRHTPLFHFKIDESVEHGVKMSRLIDEVSKTINRDE